MLRCCVFSYLTGHVYIYISGEEADHWFGLAYEKYEAAVVIKPGYNICLNNWGLALRYIT